MWVLALDTSGLTVSVVLAHRDGRLIIRQSDERRAQADILQPFVSACLAESSLALSDLAGIAVVTGPGSFTGLRIALAMGQGLARALGCKLSGYDRFSLLQAQAPHAVVVLDSLRAELYVSFPGQPAAMLLADEITAKLQGRAVVGDGAAQLGLTAQPVPPEAVLAAQALLRDLQAEVALPAALPLYVRPPDVTFPAGSA